MWSNDSPRSRHCYFAGRAAPKWSPPAMVPVGRRGEFPGAAIFPLIGDARELSSLVRLVLGWLVLWRRQISENRARQGLYLPTTIRPVSRASPIIGDARTQANPRGAVSANLVDASIIAILVMMAVMMMVMMVMTRL